MVARAETLGINPSPPAPGIATGEALAFGFAQNPHSSEGFSLQESFQEFQYDLEIKEITFKERLAVDQYGNTLTRYRLVMSDGSLRNINFCDPAERLTDIPVIETPALSTGSMGFNEEGQRMLGALGIPSILVGHEGEERDSWPEEMARFALHPWKVIQELRSIHLAKQAHVMVQVHRHINEYLAGEAPIDATQAMLLGKSRGAMTNMWVLAYSNMLEDGPEVPFGFNVATCLREALNSESRHETRRQPVDEVVHLGKMALRKLTGVSLRSLNTVNASPKSIAYEIAHIFTLLRGDAGKAVPFINRRQKYFMLGFKDDAAGQNESWEEALQEFDDIIHRVVPGTHMGIADVRTAALIMRTFDNIVQQLQSGTRPEDLNITHLRRYLEVVAA